MSSHREAPETSMDPVADNTDVYAFVSPDRPDFVTIIANFIPFQKPDGGPNFYEFGEDVSYRIHISNAGDAHTDVLYEFRFRTEIRSPNTFLYNTGPITSINSKAWNRPQYYSVHRTYRGHKPVSLGHALTCPPVNVGIRSTPHYADTFNSAAVHPLGNGRRVFAGQRSDAFFVDLGSIFDLGALRPFEHLHLIPSADAMGKNTLQGYNVHTIALQVPINELTRDHQNTKHVSYEHAVIGVYATAHRRASNVYDDKTHSWSPHGPFRQFSRLGNPLFNEVITPMAEKDYWNHMTPNMDKHFEKYVNKPELAGLLPVLYPGVFPNLAKYKKARADLHAILLTGIPNGVIKGFQNYTGPVPSDMLRLNIAVPPTDPAKASPYGILGGDLAGFPNGRRLTDDVVAIELRAIAGATIPLVDPKYKPDAAAAALKDGTSNTNGTLLKKFPYMGTPSSGYSVVLGGPGGTNNAP